MNTTIQTSAALQQVRFCGDPRAYELAEQQFPLWDYLSIIIFSLALAGTAGFFWLKKKDYFPLRERSSLLTLAIVLNFVLVTNTYPVMVLCYYFRSDPRPWRNEQFSIALRVARALILSEESLAFIIYILRSARIVFAHRARPSQRDTVLFRLFQNESNMLLLLGLLLTLKVVPPLFEPFSFATPIDNLSHMSVYSEYYFNNVEGMFQCREYFVVAYVFLSAWLIFHQRNLKPEFGLLQELLPLYCCVLVSEFVKLTFYLVNRNREWSCANQLTIPTVMLLEMLDAFLCLAVSLLYPLYRSRPNHKILPGRFLLEESKIIFTAFLSERLSLRVFHDFLLFQAKINGDFTNVQKLRFWMRTVRQRFSGFSQNTTDSAFKSSSGVLNGEREDQLPQERANRTLAQLFQIFKNRYQRTQSFNALNSLLLQNDVINTNLVMMQMTTVERERASSIHLQ